MWSAPKYIVERLNSPPHPTPAPTLARIVSLQPHTPWRLVTRNPAPVLGWGNGNLLAGVWRVECLFTKIGNID